MATTIILKNSGTTGVQPTSSQLQFGEVAINYADGKLFYKTDLGVVDFFNAKPDYGTVKSINIDPAGTGLRFDSSNNTNAPITTSGTFTVGGTLNVLNGGTGATNSSDAIKALLPSQSETSDGKFLQSKFDPVTQKTDVVWSALSSSGITGGLGYNPVDKAGDSMEGMLTLYANPTSAYHAATKEYVDNVATGLNVHLACVCATTANIDAIYNNSSSGIGATLTGSGTFPLIDNVSLQIGQRILVKDQTNKTENGIYTLAANSTTWVLIRATDFDNSFLNEITAGDFTYIQRGTLNTGTQWIMITTGVITIGVSQIVFAQFGAPTTYTAGTGISINNTTINNSGVTKVIGNKNIKVISPNSSGTGDVTLEFDGVLDVENGGTGASTPKLARKSLLPSQDGQQTKFLTTDGDDVSWATITIPMASSTVLGGVKIASNSNINISDNGTISVSNSYSDLTNKPTSLSSFSNEPGYITISSVTWANLTGTVPNVSIFSNDSGYITASAVSWSNLLGQAPNISVFSNDSNYITVSDVTWTNLSGTVPSVSNFSNDANYITVSDVTWTNLSGKPTFATVATSGKIVDLTDVTISGSILNNQVLMYDTATQKWINKSVAGGTNGQIQYNNNGDLAGVAGVTATSNKVTFNDLQNLSIGGGTADKVLGTDGAGNLSWVDVSTAGSPLVFTSSDKYRTLTGYTENGVTEPVRVAEFFNNKLRLTLATFDPSMTAATVPSSPNWDDTVTAFTVSVNNPADVTEKYISSVRSISATSGSITALNTFSVNAPSLVPAGGVDWNQSFSAGGSSWIRPISSSITGGSASATVAFSYYTGTATADYTASTANLAVTWATPTLGVSTSSLTGNTFLQTYGSVPYTVSVTGITNVNNYQNTVSCSGGSISNSLGSGTFTFGEAIHKDNISSTTRTVTVSTVFTRPATVTGTSYTATLIQTTSNVSVSFTYPSFWIFTPSVLDIPIPSDIISGTQFKSGVTTLGDQVKTFAGNVSNTNSDPRVFWFGVRSSASQPTSFKTGPTASLTSDVTVTTGNTVSLQPTSPPAGYLAEQYKLYGIVLQPGTTYVSIS